MNNIEAFFTNNLLNNDSSKTGLFRGWVIKVDSDIKVYVPGDNIIECPINADGLTLNKPVYEKVKDVLPEPYWISNRMRDLLKAEVVPCHVTFENGDAKRFVIVGYLGKGLKTADGFGGHGGFNTFGYNPDDPITEQFLSIDNASNILLVAGHGDGDPGAIGYLTDDNGNKIKYEEATLTREVVGLVSQQIAVDVFDTSKKFINQTNDVFYKAIKDKELVLEIHFNSYNTVANGCELLVENDSMPTNIEVALLEAVTSVGIAKRPTPFIWGKDIAGRRKTQNYRTSNRISKPVYTLLEICFIDNASDLSIYLEKKNEIASNIANALNSVIGIKPDVTDWDDLPISDETFNNLCKMIHAEAGGQGYDGKLAVGAVIMNRVKSNSFPNTIDEVIFADNQFSPIKDGRFYNMVPDEETIKAAKEALAGVDPTNGSLYFYNPDKSNDSWIRTRQKTVKIGDHQFAI